MKGSLALRILCDVSDGSRTSPCFCGHQGEVTSLNWWRKNLVTTLPVGGGVGINMCG